ncbi:MAG: hypothetical protein L0I80_03870 [Brevibacterium sp.]|uniref:hypothetical protein n=1 Tax=Brevibacterium sp. TaxID=1701 RepID=UPI002648B47D|nr:hypothetical protein [Brevibacterium sp.]MDN5808240.1 hypothetical protein [Brevibacterium sp.]MDN5834729.1 hypothetical protein [Brevibacterium sp.]MDN5877521.1 hypothetical protein [Brevibacterium sp.]MDN5910518.1 hypothetical protein [Brevibacterium sp.]MDN6122995.1 hypothetical protein [Brevibacterium sp.]
MTMHLGRTITTGVITAVMLIGFVAAMNAGQPLRPEDTADPSSAPGLAFALLALFSLLSVAVSFGRWSSAHDRQLREGSGPTFHTVLKEYSLTGILLVGVVQGACLSLAMLICRGFAVDTGAPGTMWAEFFSTPLPVLAVFAAAWASTNIGLAYLSLMMFVRKIVVLSIIGLLLFVALGCGIMVAFGWLESADPVVGFLVAVVVALVTIPALIGTRTLALATGRA